MNSELLEKTNEFLTKKRNYVEEFNRFQDYLNSLKGKCFSYKNKKYKILSIDFYYQYLFSGNTFYIEINKDGSDKYKKFIWIKTKNMNNKIFFDKILTNEIVIE